MHKVGNPRPVNPRRALATAAQPTGWLALRADPQWLPALGISLLVGVLATTLSAVFTAVLIAGTHTHPAWSRLMKALPPALATPHAAFAIGFAFLIAPSGWARPSLSRQKAGSSQAFKVQDRKSVV